jgi:tetratricopeptide (TPR) repeat protein
MGRVRRFGPLPRQTRTGRPCNLAPAETRTSETQRAWLVCQETALSDFDQVRGGMKDAVACVLVLSQLLASATYARPSLSGQGTQDVAPKHAAKHVQVDWHAKLEKLQKQLAHDPRSAFLHGQAAVAYDALGDVSNFEKQIDLAMDLDRKSPTYCYWAYAVYKRRNLTEQATAVLNRALEIDPNNPLGHYERGATFERKGAWRSALAEYQLTKRLLEVAKRNTNGFYYRGPSTIGSDAGYYDVTYIKENIDEDVARMRAAVAKHKQPG